MLWPRDEHDIMTRACKHAAVIAAYCTRTHYGDLHIGFLVEFTDEKIT